MGKGRRSPEFTRVVTDASPDLRFPVATSSPGRGTDPEGLVSGPARGLRIDRISREAELLNLAAEGVGKRQTGCDRGIQAPDFEGTDCLAGDSCAVGQLLLRPTAGLTKRPDLIAQRRVASHEMRGGRRRFRMRLRWPEAWYSQPIQSSPRYDRTRQWQDCTNSNGQCWGVRPGCPRRLLVSRGALSHDWSRGLIPEGKLDREKVPVTVDLSSGFGQVMVSRWAPAEHRQPGRASRRDAGTSERKLRMQFRH
jgi:hypothetical protein